MKTEIPGILLAAGGSQRLNQPKQLLKIDHSLLINHIISIIRNSGIEELFIVLGADFELIQSAIKDQGAYIVVNRKWREGISSSINAGIKSLEESVDAAMLFVVDQPFLTSDLIRKLIHKYRNSDKNIAAPVVNQQQCNPVIFSKELFPDLLNLNGNQGGKKIIRNKSVEWLEWDDEKLLLDIDTEMDYLEILSIL